MKKETTKKVDNTEVLEKAAKKVAEKMQHDLDMIEREKTVEAIAEDLKKDHKEVFITVTL